MPTWIYAGIYCQTMPVLVHIAVHANRYRHVLIVSARQLIRLIPQVPSIVKEPPTPQSYVLDTKSRTWSSGAMWWVEQFRGVAHHYNDKADEWFSKVQEARGNKDHMPAVQHHWLYPCPRQNHLPLVCSEEWTAELTIGAAREKERKKQLVKKLH